jgi:carbonic anhydrase
MDRLMEGYRRFRAEVWPRERERFQQLAEGQRPHTLLIACSDSRVDPAMVFGAAPGEMFVVRNVAALVPPYQPDGGRHGVSAALEFGVRVLEVERIVVLGHGRCTGVKALLLGSPKQARDFLEPWMSIAEPALWRSEPRREEGTAQERGEKDVVRLSVDNLKTFPWIRDRVANGALKLIGARFEIASGELSFMDDDGRFVPVEPHPEDASARAAAAG